MAEFCYTVHMDKNEAIEVIEKTVKKDLGILKKVGKEFQAFVSRGNVVDLAVGVIIGGAFGSIVSSLVNDILMPLIGIMMGGFNFSGLSLKVGEAAVNYGNFIQNTIDFLIIALCIFIFVKIINKIHASSVTKVEDKKVQKKEDEQLKVLKEIRDLLKNQ